MTQNIMAPVPNAEQRIIPSIQALCTTTVDQNLVQQSLEQLNHTATQVTSKLKSKKEKVEVVWPQDCAFVGHLKA